MDALDEQIIGILQENARRSFSDLGRTIGLSTNATAARVRRLEESGIILGYTIRTGSDAPDPRGGLEVFIDVRLDEATDFDVFAERVGSIGEIVDAVHMTGPYDGMVRAFTRDTASLDRLLRRLKKECGAAQTQTRVALRSR
ncbi:Lrp/AsnC family transcriptional regulator [Microbacterium sp. 22303]|uniref:Lrp/AsnC family transcriptional regulator n=1 Tax=Microbacterium sp. 22303 TaxID=3453905 RepID=UPI003F862BF1